MTKQEENKQEKTTFVPPLAVHLIWGSKDYAYYSEGHEDYLDKISKFVLEFRKYLTRDPDKQFSRTLDIPTFLYCNDNPKKLPKLKKVAKKDIVFFFVTPDMVRKEWDNYIDEIILKVENDKNEKDTNKTENNVNNRIEEKYIIPVALNGKSLNFSLYDSMIKKNFVRLDNLKNEETKLESIIKLLYELYKRVWGKELVRKTDEDVNLNKDKNINDKKNDNNMEDDKNYEPIKLFLSHTKKDGSGYAYAKSIIRHIATLNIGRFFDIYDIPPGANFEKEIEKNIEKSTFVAIMSDNYSTRYWCQRELISAKKNNRPIVIVNCMEEYEDRSFSAITNLPSVRVPYAKSKKYTKKERVLQLDIFDKELNVKTTHSLLSSNIKYKVKSKDSMKILVAAMIETIRCEYSIEILKFYQGEDIKFLKDAEIISRPPESWQIQEAIKSGKNICYPEPPIYHRELKYILSAVHEITKGGTVEISTPLWSGKYYQDNGEWKEKELVDNNKSLNLRVGLSIANYLYFSRENLKNNKKEKMSNVHILDCEKHSQHVDELERFSQTLVRYLLARNCKLIYGGDLRDNGYTEFILNEARITKDRLHKDKIKDTDTDTGTDKESENDAYVLNYIAWPYYLEEKTKEWCVNEPGLFEVTKVEPTCVIDTDKYIDKSSINNLYIRSQCLTKMRKESINKSNARVFAGGKIRGYSGIMPGIVEEFIISLKTEKPIYLVGGLGGVTKLLCDGILWQEVPRALMKDWQETYNKYLEYPNLEYKKLYKKLVKCKSNISYEHLICIFSTPDLLKYLSYRSGLTEEEYKRLMETPFVDEAVHLIIEGLDNINRRKDSEHAKSCCGVISDMLRKFCFGADI